MLKLYLFFALSFFFHNIMTSDKESNSQENNRSHIEQYYLMRSKFTSQDQKTIELLLSKTVKKNTDSSNTCRPNENTPLLPFITHQKTSTHYQDRKKQNNDIHCSCTLL